MHLTVVSGTNREGSRTLRVARRVAARLEAEGADVTLLDLRDLPPEIFTPTAYASRPAAFDPFNDAILRADGVVIVTPEYNGGFPGVLKLFLDHLDHPHAVQGRPVAFVGVAAGRWGALRPVEQLVQVWGYRNGYVFPERVLLPSAVSTIGDDGEPVDDASRARLDRQARDFVAFVRALRGEEEPP